MVVALIALFVALGGTTYAATGGSFILGGSNSADRQTSLSASVNGATPGGGKALRLTNTNTGAGATALGLNVASGKTPFTVNSTTKVAKLNADRVDGREAADLVGPRAYASIGEPCAGSPIPFCTIKKGKGVAYAARIDVGRYCVGVSGVNAADPDIVAVVTSGPDDTFADRAAGWFPSFTGCVDSEFEILTTVDNNGSAVSYNGGFIILIP